MAFHFSMDVSVLEARGPVAGDEWQLCHWSIDWALSPIVHETNRFHGA